MSTTGRSLAKTTYFIKWTVPKNTKKRKPNGKPSGRKMVLEAGLEPAIGNPTSTSSWRVCQFHHPSTGCWTTARRLSKNRRSGKRKFARKTKPKENVLPKSIFGARNGAVRLGRCEVRGGRHAMPHVGYARGGAREVRAARVRGEGVNGEDNGGRARCPHRAARVIRVGNGGAIITSRRVCGPAAHRAADRAAACKTLSVCYLQSRAPRRWRGGAMGTSRPTAKPHGRVRTGTRHVAREVCGERCARRGARGEGRGMRGCKWRG